MLDKIKNMASDLGSANVDFALQEVILIANYSIRKMTNAVGAANSGFDFFEHDVHVKL